MDIRLFSSGKKFHQVGRAENLQSLMSHQSVHELPAEVTRELQFTDKMLYIYTSGTTGLPKAAVVKNSRLETKLFIYQEGTIELPSQCYVQFTD